MEFEEDDPLYLKLDDVAIRQTAATRVWICPGAGFAIIGRPALGLLSYVIMIAAALGLGWFFFEPNPRVGWSSLALFGVSIALWVGEMIAIRRASILPAESALLVQGYLPATVIAWGASAWAVFGGVAFIGTIVMAGSGMTPTANDHEQLVYHKRLQADDLGRGCVVVYRASEGSALPAGTLGVARIVALPGDRLSTKEGRYLVNGEPGPRLGKAMRREPAIVVPKSPAELTVPDDCYFVSQDNPKGSYDSCVLSWAEHKNLVSNRIWYLREDRFLARLE